MRARTKRMPRKTTHVVPRLSRGPKKRTRVAEKWGRSRGPKPEAILLLGPTGSGKTPLGAALQKHGLSGKRCIHFDFGANLREVGGLKRRPPGFTVKDRTVILDSLRTGALLENENFPTAEKIMRRFSRRHRMKKGDILVLNGLPRHEGQAADLGRTVAVKTIIYLKASINTVRERIRRNTDGDRTARRDDSPAEIKRKYAIFQKRTRALLDYYARRRAKVLVIPLDVRSTLNDVSRRLADLLL